MERVLSDHMQTLRAVCYIRSNFVYTYKCIKKHFCNSCFCYFHSTLHFRCTTKWAVYH